MIKDFSRQHRSIKYISKTQPALNAQLGFMKTLTDNVTVICEAQYTAEAGIGKLAAKMNQGSGREMCGRFAEIENFYGEANRGLTFLQKTTSDSLAKIRSGHLEGANKNRSNLDEIDMKSGNNNATKERAPLVTFPHSTGTELDPTAKIETASSPHISLREELGIIWGANLTTSKGQQAADFKPDSNSFYGGVLSRLENESKQLKFLNEKFAVQKAKMGSMRNDCVAAGFELPPSTVADTASEQPDISGYKSPTERHPQKDADLDPNAGRTQQPPATLATDTSDTNTDTNTNTDLSLLNGDDRLKNPPYVPPEKEPKPEKPPVKTEEEGWISRNSGLLLTVGGGAAAVGGLLWYKNSQDKKAKREAEALEMEANAMAASQSNSTSSSTSTSTNTDSTVGGTPANEATPQGSKLVISGIPSGSVAANTRLPEITVAIINPAGILTQDSQTEIIVSCIQPAGCSLSGTGQARTSAGKAKFNDLRFTSAHESVKLMFTAPGFDSVTSVSFGVTGGSGTDTTTATSTSTTTSTSTNTGGNRE
jgi:hypothetical protein